MFVLLLLLLLEPGHYLIIPSCYDEGVNGEFLLRIYTENVISDKDCSILHDHKDHLCDEDIFFKNPASLDDAFGSWSGLLAAAVSNPETTSNGEVSRQSTRPVSSARRPDSSIHIDIRDDPTTLSSSVASSSSSNGPNYIKQFKVYMDNQVLGVYEKIDIKKKTRHFKL